MVAANRKLILIPAHSRMEERVYTNSTYRRIDIDLESLFTAVDTSANDTTIRDGIHQVGTWKREGKAIVAKLFREAVSDLAAEHVDHDDPAATMAADELLDLLADPTNVSFQYSGLPLDGRALTPGQLIADINVSLNSGISEPLKYGIHLRSGCVAA